MHSNLRTFRTCIFSYQIFVSLIVLLFELIDIRVLDFAIKCWLHLVHEPWLTIVGATLGQNFTSSLGTQQRLFELGRPEAIFGNGGPIVWPLFIAPVALGYHRFNGEHMTGLHHANSIIFWNKNEPGNLAIAIEMINFLGFVWYSLA